MTKSIKLFLLMSLFAIFSFGGMVSAQETVEVEIPNLVEFVDEGQGFKALIPEEWSPMGANIYGRQDSVGDITVVGLQTTPISAAATLESLLPQLLLSEAPESTGTYQGVIEWTLYDVLVSFSGIDYQVGVALSNLKGVTYIVLFQSSPEEYEALSEGIYYPILDAFEPLTREDNTADLPYIAEDLTFDNGDVTLAGTLTRPETEGQHPAVILVSGSGPQNRNENLGGGIAIEPFRLISDALTREGIAVLRYDDRGVAESTGDFNTATIPDFASDAEAAINYLLTRDDINHEQIGIIGHSEGGIVAAMLGAKNPDLAFIVTLAGPAVDGETILLSQNEMIIKAGGGTQEEADNQVAFVQSILEVLGDEDAIYEKAYNRILAQFNEASAEELEAMGNVEDYAALLAQQLASQYSASWFESFVTYDPSEDLAQVQIPMLAIFAEKDVQVLADMNVEALEAIITESGNPDVEIVTIESTNHLFQITETGSFEEYVLLPNEFSPELLPTIIDWLHDRVTIIE